MKKIINTTFLNPTERFTENVQEYIQYRPTYPKQILQVLTEDCRLTKDKTVADIASGTGILTKLWLDYGCPVYGVEPNQAMRKAAENYLKDYVNFYSIDGTAEATTLKDNSVDIITVGTAFHWFDVNKAKIEFKRILHLPGWVLLAWNVRNTEQSALMQDYENLLLKYGEGYRESSARKFDKAILEKFFAPCEMKEKTFANSQQFDWEGLKGRLLSTSYSLRVEDTNYEEMLRNLHIIFERYQKNGLVEFSYNTKLHYGILK